MLTPGGGFASETWRDNVVGHACILDASCYWRSSWNRGLHIGDGGRQRRRGGIGRLRGIGSLT